MVDPGDVPDEEEYAEHGGLFDCYTLRSFLGKHSNLGEGSVHEVAWSGAPAASLRRAFMVLAHFHLINVLPEGLEGKLRELFGLYQRRMPRFGESATAQNSGESSTLAEVLRGAGEDTAPPDRSIARFESVSHHNLPRPMGIPRQSSRNAREHAFSVNDVPSLGHLSSPLSPSMPSTQSENVLHGQSPHAGIKAEEDPGVGRERSTQRNIDLYLKSLEHEHGCSS